ncbi:MAG: YybH family protein [Candidatus Latescibacterota bacterium]
MSPEDEVLATARKIIDAFNAQDKETTASLHDLISAFAADGSLLHEADGDRTNGQPRSIPDRWRHYAQPSPTYTWSMSHWKHPKVHVEGDMAFMTGYLVGFWEREDQRHDFVWRDTLIFAKREGAWKRIHHHTSNLDLQGMST